MNNIQRWIPRDPLFLAILVLLPLYQYVMQALPPNPHIAMGIFWAIVTFALTYGGFIYGRKPWRSR
jgi:hypothetical protein